MFLKNRCLSEIIIVVFATILGGTGLGVQFTRADWSEPTVAPPNGNVSVPWTIGGGMSIFSLTHAQTYTTAWGGGGDTMYAYLTINKDGTWTISTKTWCPHSGVWWNQRSADNAESLCGIGKLDSSDSYFPHCIKVYTNANTYGYLGIFGGGSGEDVNLANVFISH